MDAIRIVAGFDVIPFERTLAELQRIRGCAETMHRSQVGLPCSPSCRCRKRALGKLAAPATADIESPVLCM